MSAGAGISKTENGNHPSFQRDLARTRKRNICLLRVRWFSVRSPQLAIRYHSSPSRTHLPPRANRNVQHPLHRALPLLGLRYGQDRRSLQRSRAAVYRVRAETRLDGAGFEGPDRYIRLKAALRIQLCIEPDMTLGFPMTSRPLAGEPRRLTRRSSRSPPMQCLSQASPKA